MNGKLSILITGGFGNLGSWLCEHFYRAGFEVTVLTLRLRDVPSIHYHHVIQADIAQLDSLNKAIQSSYDYCIHTASYNEHFQEGYPEKSLLINALGTRNLVEVLKHKLLKKFIYLSTFHVYGNSANHIDETCLPSPMNDYATTHLFAEYYLKQFRNTDKFPSIICRLTNSYGAPKTIDSTKWYLVLNDLVKSAFEHQHIKLSSNGQSSRDFVWMGDVCEVMEKLFASGVEEGVFNLSSGQSYKVIALAKMVKDVYCKRYNRNIDIVLNEHDGQEYFPVKVCNKKLLDAVPHVFTNKLDEEIVGIFDLLEAKYV